MVPKVNGNIQGTGNEAESQKSTVPSFLIAVLTPQEVKNTRHKDKG